MVNESWDFFHKTSAFEKHNSGIMHENPEGPLPPFADAHGYSFPA